MVSRAFAARSPLPLLAAALVGLAGGASLGCSKPSPTSTETVSREDFEAMKRELQVLREAHEADERASQVPGLDPVDFGARLSRLTSEVRALKDSVAALQTASGTTPLATANPDGGTKPAETAPTPLSPDGGFGTDPTFTEDQVRAAKALMEEVDRRKEDERAADRLKTGLDRIGVALPQEQFDALAKLDARYRREMNKLFRTGFNRSDDERKVAQDKMETLRQSWEGELRALVAPADADKIVENASRFGIPGLGPRRGAGIPGMQGSGR